MANRPGAPGLASPDPSLAPFDAQASGGGPAAAEVAEIVEPIDEVLQQVTEQTLHVNHLETAVREVAQAVADLGESTQAGLVEVRGLAAQAAGHAGGEAGGGLRALGERVDELEAAAARSARRQIVLLVVATLQLAILLFVVALETGAVSFRKKSEDFAFAPPPSTPVAAPAAIESARVAPVPPAPPSTPPRAKRRPRH